VKALVWSDLHAHNFREFSELNEGINSRLAEQLSCLDRITDCAEESKVDVIFFLGDLFHLKNALDSKVIKLVAGKVQILSQKAAHGLWVVSGNHDYIRWDRDAAILDVLRELGSGRVELFSDVPAQQTLDGWQIFIAPYARRLEETEVALKTAEIQERSIFLGHQDLVGQYYGGFKVEKGLDPDMLSAKFQWSFVGHFHESKLVRPNVISVGSPLQLSFSEMAHEVGWWLLDTEREPQLQFIKNEESPEFLELVLGAGQEIDFGDDKNYYRVKAKGVLAPEGITKLKWHRLSFEGVRDKLSKERSEIKFSDPAEALIEKYIRARNINGLDEENLKTLGRRYLQ